MAHLTFGHLFLILVPVYASAFFWGPGCWASQIDSSGRPTHEVTRDFRIWQRERVWVAATGLATCLIAPLLFGPEIAFPVAVFVGLAALCGTDALRIRGISLDQGKVG